MGVLTSQQITKYYERYRTISVTFTKEIITATGLVTQQVYLKCLGEAWPCVIYSTSFEEAKVIINTKSGLYGKLQQANNLVNLRYSFKISDKTDPMFFFVSCRVVGSAPYQGSQDISMMTLQFTQRPPDDLIEIMGRLLDANINSSKRRDERILITPESIRKLRLAAKETVLYLQGVPRRCILRDISFSGAKTIMVGVAKFIADKEVTLRLDFEDPRESHIIGGKVVRIEDVEGRKELVAVAIHFNENQVPMNYKMRINDYLSQIRTEPRTETAEETAQKPQGNQDTKEPEKHETNK
ncbi:PilZ domain-containing protein [Gracilinema caldarium]|uniref:Type IV pilus assembly PilZ n=1 Tax=Gracilinema caldarium (strain ATCC 51460 / DSM 7334 / H1) TaxID=744872 RepID=F8EX86_GRAC1|nr:PilZ domain-containing protein [Gracilinema caldarium]AEJ18829.1 type IV pilus assembly PilZ [Gracilinema caldarium DSM 7334]